MSRGIAIIAGVLAVASLLSGCSRLSDAGGKDERAAATTVVQVETVVEEHIDEHRRITGDVAAWDVVPLTFTVGGRITKIFFDEGAFVKKGELLAVLDSRDYKLMRDLARAQVKALDPHVKRAERLMGEEAVTQAQMDELLSKMDVARIQKSQAETQLAYARLKSPASGVVIKRMAAVGDMTDPSHPVGILADLKRVKVILPVPQRDLYLFEEGKNVEIKAPGTERVFLGKVFSVGYAADQTTRTFPVTLEVSNEDLTLRAGMIVEAEIVVVGHDGIFIPLDVVSRDIDGSAIVMVADPGTGTAVARRLILGLVLGQKVLVKSGLKRGERYVLRGMVRSGDPITVMETAAARVDMAPR
jgi:RND family efflux transporter MFP subunit